MEERVRARLFWHLEHLTSEELEKFKLLYLVDHIPRGHLEGANHLQVADVLVSSLGEQEAWELALSIWEKMGLRELCQRAQEDERNKYQERMREKFQFVSEKNSRPGEHELFHQRFAQLLLLREFRIKEEKQHELLAQGWEHSQVIEKRGQLIEVWALFDPDQRTGAPPRTVVLQGPAGIGKTTLAIKVMLDWAKEKLYQERFNYVFYLCCRELNSLGERKISFANLILKEWPGPQAPMTEITSQPERLLFIIDGLDELKFPCNEHSYDLCKDWKQQRPVSLLLSSLLRKTLLPKASLLLTTRLTALGKFSPLLENPRHIEILGFAVEQREEYFRKFFGNDDLAEKAFSLVADNATLFTLCSVPLMNWTVCTCLKQQIQRGQDPMLALKTTTALYMCYISSVIHDDKNLVPGHLRNLCQLAAEGIWERKLLFEEEDLRRYDLEAADVSAFLNLNIFQKDSDCENCYSFIHLSFQEFFAALFYVMSTDKEGMRRPNSSIPDVKKLLEEYTGNDTSFVELVVRFLFGFLNAERAIELERKFRCKMSPEIKSQLLQWTKGENQRVYERPRHSKIRIPLWYSFLYETQDAEFAAQALDNVHEIKVEVYNHYEALTAVFCIQHCPRAWRIFFTCDVDLSDGVWQDLFSVFNKNPNLKELFMYLGYSCHSLENICVELTKVNCKLEKLSLETQVGTYSSFQYLFSIPTLKSLHLDISSFETDDMKLPQETLGQKNCQLQTLCLRECDITSACYQKLFSAISGNKSLKNLDLSGIFFKSIEIKFLCEVLENPNCKIETLRLKSHDCNPKYFQNFCSALINNKSLKNLNFQTLWFEEEEDINPLCNVLGNPGCQIETLCLEFCRCPPICFQNLCSALNNNKSLKNLDLSETTFIEEEDTNFLCKALGKPNCRIERLRLQYCHYSLKCFQNLCSALNRNESLKNLDLSGTYFKEEDSNLLCKVLGKPKCKIETLRFSLKHTSLSCLQDLLHVICSSKSLKTWDLGPFVVHDERIKLLCEAFENQNCKVQTLILSKGSLSEESVRALTSLKSRKGFCIIWKDYEDEITEFLKWFAEDII